MKQKGIDERENMAENREICQQHLLSLLETWAEREKKPQMVVCYRDRDEIEGSYLEKKGEWGFEYDLPAFWEQWQLDSWGMLTGVRG